MATAWVLNLDADLELEAFAVGARYAPTRTVLAAMEVHAARLAERWLRPGDVWVREGTRAVGLVGRAFCPTPRALAALERAGATAEPHPDVAVLARVNGRAFCAELGPTLPGAAFVRDLAAAERVLSRSPPEGDAWRLKRAFGMSGRNQRLARGSLSFLPGWLAHGVTIEPNVPIVDEWARHALLAPDGALVVGRLVRQVCDAHGQWVESVAADAVASSGLTGLDEALEREVRGVGRALHEAGYFGPFGVDAFRYRARDGSVRLQPRSEINARYSMGWAVGMR